MLHHFPKRKSEKWKISVRNTPKAFWNFLLLPPEACALTNCPINPDFAFPHRNNFYRSRATINYELFIAGGSWDKWTITVAAFAFAAGIRKRQDKHLFEKKSAFSDRRPLCNARNAWETYRGLCVRSVLGKCELTKPVSNLQVVSMSSIFLCNARLRFDQAVSWKSL